ncbi:MAG: 16S rRNA (guanine(966)-N(2))-methyltransferase RsmD [Christensenellales bacterium]|jgi:16S rRNA (guanine966-N2)-methyltransferase
MRVIAGEYKGRRLASPKDADIRPTTDKVKEAMFGSLHFDIRGANVLDAFAGSGALGIEALSRGAAHVDFVEKNTQCLRILNGNLRQIAKGASYQVFKGDVLKIMPGLKRYDIMIIDPPYDSDIYIKVLEHAHISDILYSGCTIVMECRRKFDFILPVQYNFLKKRDYGDISLWFLTYGERCE